MGCFAEIDHDTNAMFVIEEYHGLLHEGKYFKYNYYSTGLGSSSGRSILLYNPSTNGKEVHLAAELFLNGAGLMKVFENPGFTSSSNLTSATAYNMNRESTNVTGMTIYSSGIATSSGAGWACLGYYPVGTNNNQTKAGGLVRPYSEFILAADTYYGIVFQNDSTSAIGSLTLEWYEV